MSSSSTKRRGRAPGQSLGLDEEDCPDGREKTVRDRPVDPARRSIEDARFSSIAGGTAAPSSADAMGHRRNASAFVKLPLASHDRSTPRARELVWTLKPRSALAVFARRKKLTSRASVRSSTTPAEHRAQDTQDGYTRERAAKIERRPNRAPARLGGVARGLGGRRRCGWRRGAARFGKGRGTARWGQGRRATRGRGRSREGRARWRYPAGDATLGAVPCSRSMVPNLRCSAPAMPAKSRLARAARLALYGAGRFPTSKGLNQIGRAHV